MGLSGWGNFVLARMQSRIVDGSAGLRLGRMGAMVSDCWGRQMVKIIRVRYTGGALKSMEALDMAEGAEALATPDVLHKMSSDERMNR